MTRWRDRELVNGCCFFGLLASTLPDGVTLPSLGASVRPVPVCLFILALLAINRKQVARVAARHRVLLVLAVVTYLWGWLSALASDYRAVAIPATIRASVYMPMFLALLMMTAERGRLRHVYRGLVIFLFVLACGGVLEFLFLSYRVAAFGDVLSLFRPGLSDFPRVSSFMQRPNQFGIVMAIGAVVTAPRERFGQFGGGRRQAGFLCFIVCLALAASRSGWLVFVVGTSALLLYRVISVPRWTGVMLSFLCALLVFDVSTVRLGIPENRLVPLQQHLERRVVPDAARTEDSPPTVILQSRLDAWALALEQFRGAPIVGVGPRAFTPAMEDQLAERRRIGVPNVPGRAHDSAHNLFLNVLAEIGIVGFALVLACAVRLLRDARLDSAVVTVPLVLLLVGQLFDYLVFDLTFMTIGLFFWAAAANSRDCDPQPLGDRSVIPMLRP